MLFHATHGLITIVRDVVTKHMQIGVQISTKTDGENDTGSD